MGNQFCPAEHKDYMNDKQSKNYDKILQECLSAQPGTEHDQNKAVNTARQSVSTNPQTMRTNHMTLKQSQQGENSRVRATSQVGDSRVANQQIFNVTDLQVEGGWKYTGPVLRGLPQGKGIEVGPQGEEYNGMFKKGKKCGYGIYKFPNKSIYRGHFRQNLMWGYGEFEFPNGDVFKGLFMNNLRQGKGTYIPRQPNINGILYFQGEYKDDIKNGPGVLKYEQQQVRGRWVNGIYDCSGSI